MRRQFLPKKRIKQSISMMVLGTLFCSQVSLSGFAQTLSPDYTANATPVSGKISIASGLNIAGQDKKVSLNMRDANIRDVLNILAKTGNFNIILDSSVDGQLTVDITDVSIDKALEYIFMVSDLTYSKSGNTLIVANKAAAEASNLTATTFKAIPVLYKNAEEVAEVLNETIFSFSRPGGTEEAVASFDPNSNSLLIMGTDADIELVANALRELDVPRNNKVYQVKHNSALYVAQMLAANHFGFGAAGGGQAGAGGGANAVNGGGGGAQGGGVQGGAGQAGGVGGGVGGAGGGQQGQSPLIPPDVFTQIIQSGGVKLIVNDLASTITAYASEEQLALIDATIAQYDLHRPQVAIEVALVELTNSDTKQFLPEFSALSFGDFRLGLLTGLTGGGGLTSTLNYIRGQGELSNDLDTINITARLTNTKSKILANPTVVAVHGQATNISITDEVGTATQTTTVTAVGPVISTEITKEQAGVTLDMTPFVNQDGTVILNLSPSVSQPTLPFAAGGSTTFLISERAMTLTGVRVVDGQTLVIGGLLREVENIDTRKVPGLSALPIVGAMFRGAGAGTGNTKNKTELVLMVTPHILKEEGVHYFDGSDTGYNTGSRNQYFPNSGAHSPAPLPQFTGNAEPSETEDVANKDAGKDASISKSHKRNENAPVAGNAVSSEAYAAVMNIDDKDAESGLGLEVVAPKKFKTVPPLPLADQAEQHKN